jgi:hypothetical protein
MLVVTNAAGRVAAAAHMPEGQPSKMNVGIKALPGQEIHEVQVPEEITRLKSGHEFHVALSHATFNRATRTLEFPKVTYKRVEH